MAAPVTKLPQIQLPAGPAPETPDQRYWRSFRSHLQVSSPSSYPVTHITTPTSAPQHSAAAPSDLFAVTAGPRVQVFSSRTKKAVKTVSRFDDVARSGDIRRDGRILLAGDDTGTIQAFDINSRAILKTWKEHKQPVWTTKFAPSDLTTLMSASDDRTVRLWDLPSQQSTRLFSGHGDYVRTGAFLAGTNSDILVSGSYDETVRVWDSRAPGRAVMTFKHHAPVECVLPMPSGTTVLASSDDQVSVLDLVAGKPLQLLKAHQKTVTSLCLASKANRVVAAGLDGHLKVFETMSWNVVAGYKYPSPILAVSVIPSGGVLEDKHLVVGLQSGLLSIRTRSSQQERKRESEREKEMQALMQGNLEEHDRKKSKKRSRKWERMHRGMEFSGEGADIIIEDGPRRKKKKKKKKNKPMAPWQIDLRKGRYGAALDGVLNKSYRSATVFTLLVALRHRSATRTALQGRDEVSLQPILRWLIKHLPDPRYVAVAADVSLVVVELYAMHLGQSQGFDRQVRELRLKARKEVERAQEACQTSGMLGLLMAGGGKAV